MSRADLILYATPVGPLADALDGVFADLSATSPTTAQEYPPHCTLTGFFRRDIDEIVRIGAELARTIDHLGPRPGDAVRVEGLHRRADWVGLELASDWLRLLTRSFVEEHRVDDGDDGLRPKDWLHVSIAYGVDDLGPALDRTTGFDPTLPVEWELGLWQRHGNGEWTRHRTEHGR